MTDRTMGDRFRDREPGYSTAEPEEDYSPEDSYSHWNKGRSDSVLSSVSRNSGIVLGVIGAAVFILIGLIVGLPMLKQNPVDPAVVTDLDARIRKLESRLVDLESARPTHDPVPSILEDRVKHLTSRVEKLEGASPVKAAPLAVEPEKVQPPPAASETVSAAKPAVVPPAVKTPAPSKPAPKAEDRYHDVKPKETLFSIARMYGLSVDELRKINGMGSQDVLKSGQKLRVSR